MGDSFCNFQERSVSYTYVLLVQSVASLAPLVCWPKVMTPVPAEPEAQSTGASKSLETVFEITGCVQMVLDWMCFLFVLFRVLPKWSQSSLLDSVFWSRVSQKKWCYAGSFSPCSTHPDTPILLSLPDINELLHDAMACSEILRIRLWQVEFLILLPKI